MTTPNALSDNLNRLSIPELEARIDALESQLRRKRADQRQVAAGWYICTRCGSLYQHFGGCGCAIPALVEQLKAAGPAYTAEQMAANFRAGMNTARMEDSELLKELRSGHPLALQGMDQRNIEIVRAFIDEKFPNAHK